MLDSIEIQHREDRKLADAYDKQVEKRRDELEQTAKARHDAIQRLITDQSISGFFKKLEVPQDVQVGVLEQALKLVVARNGAETVAEKVGTIRSASAETIYKIINHTGLALVHMLNHEDDPSK